MLLTNFHETFFVYSVSAIGAQAIVLSCRVCSRWVIVRAHVFAGNIKIPGAVRLHTVFAHMHLHARLPAHNECRFGQQTESLAAGIDLLSWPVALQRQCQRFICILVDVLVFELLHCVSYNDACS